MGNSIIARLIINITQIFLIIQERIVTLKEALATTRIHTNARKAKIEKLKKYNKT